MPTHPSSPFSHAHIRTHHEPDSSPPRLTQWACYKKASAYGSRVGWTLARSIHPPCLVDGSNSLFSTSLQILFTLPLCYTLHFVIHAFSPNHSYPFLKHILIISTYFAVAPLKSLTFWCNINIVTIHYYLIHHLFLVSLKFSTHYTWTYQIHHTST